MPDSPNLILPYIQASQGQKHITHNEAVKLLDGIVQLGVISRSLTAPPALPADGARYIVASGATGLWAGWDLNVVYFADGAWTRLIPRPGWAAFSVADASYFFWNGSAWIGYGGPAFLDTAFAIFDNVDPTKILQFDTSTFSTGTTRTFQFPNASGVVVDQAATQTLTNKTLTAPVINTSVTGTAVTQTAIDTTANRLMKVGDFGLGLNNISATDIADMDAHRINGFFRWAVGATGLPPGSAAGVFMHVTRLSNTEHHQIAFSNVDRIHRRRWTGGAWGSWQEIFHAGSMLGTVSQSGGVPTGRVMQHGSSANGFFERRASGRAVCTRTDQTTPDVSTAYGSLFRSADIVWTFPTAFFAGTLPAVAFSADDSDVIGFRVISLSATVVTFQLVGNASIATTTTVRASAIGRWSDMI